MPFRCFHRFGLALVALCAMATLSLAQSSRVANKAPSSAHHPANPDHYRRLPLAFIRNEGQADKQVQFLAHSDNLSLFLTPGEAVFSLSRPIVFPKRHEKQPATKPQAIRTSVVRMRLRAGNPHAIVNAMEALPGRVNYFLGNDPAKWRSNVPTYARVRYSGVYPGVDLVYYGNNRQLEYDFVVAPHADPKRIALSFAGTKHVRIERSGELELALEVGSLRWHRPVVYQQVNGRRKIVSGRYVALGRSSVGFEVGKYAPDLPLVIDPQLAYSTYLGGTGSETEGDFGSGIAVNGKGETFIVGTTYSFDFPVTKGDFQNILKTMNGNAFVTRLSADGATVIYSTYLGGTGSTFYGDRDPAYDGDWGLGIAVDAADNAYVTGWTTSSDFPTTKGAFQTTRKNRGQHAFVTKISANGASLVYSSYLGGSGYTDSQGDIFGDFGRAIAVDAQGSAYVAGQTRSSDFPVTKGAFQTQFNNVDAGSNAFVTKFSPDGSTLAYSTYLGGANHRASGGDSAFGITVDSLGHAYVTGEADSSDFPVTKGAFQSRLNGISNAFVTKLNTAGSALVYSTLLGGSKSDAGNSIAVDALGNAYVVGGVESSDFPVTAGAFQTRQNALAGLIGFVTKFNATGSSLIYSTYLGGSGANSLCNNVVVDALGDAYVVGTTFALDFPITPGAFQTKFNNKTSGSNAFVTKLSKDGSALVYSTYFGGKGTGQYTGDFGTSIAIDAMGNAYFTGIAESRDFPTTPDAFQSTLKSDNGNAFVAKLLVPVDTYFAVLPHVAGSHGEKVVLTATLNISLNKAGIPGENVVFTRNTTVLGTAVTDAHGKASLPYTIPDALSTGKTYPIQVSFSGDSAHAPTVDSGTLSIVQGKTEFTALPDATGTKGALVKFTVKLVRTSDGTPLSRETVTFAVDGGNIGMATTNSLGVASLSYTIPKNARAGTHSTQAAFGGDTNYLRCRGTGTLTVTQ